MWRRPVWTSKSDVATAEAIARILADAPPLSAETKARLAELFSAAHRHRTHG